MQRFAFFSVLILVAPFLWAANFIAARSVHDVSDPLWLNSARWDAAALVLLPVLWRDRRNVAAALRTHSGTLILLALLGVVGSNTLIYYGLEHANATQVGVVYGVTPFLILLMARLGGGARLDPRQSWAGVIAFSGVCFILTGGEMAVLQQEATTGALFVLAGGGFWALFTVRLGNARLVLAPLSLVALLAVIGAILMLPLWWLRPAPAPEAMGPVLGVAAFLGIAGSAVAFWAWGLTVARLGACRAGLGLQLIPVFGALLGWAVLGEVPTLAHLIGIALVVTGLFLACQPGLGSARPACLKAGETTGLTDALRNHYPKDRRDGYFGRADPGWHGNL